MKLHIDGKDATYVAIEASKRDPIRVEAAEKEMPANRAPAPQTPVAAPGVPSRPPRLRKPSSGNDKCLAPTDDLESHRARLREVFGNTLSDEFVDRCGRHDPLAGPDREAASAARCA